MHKSAPLALCDFFPQIWQTHIGTVALNQFLFSVLALPPAFLTGQPNDIAGIFKQLKRAVHGVSGTRTSLTASKAIWRASVSPALSCRRIEA
jgi:hypothetical protein